MTIADFIEHGRLGHVLVLLVIVPLIAFMVGAYVSTLQDDDR